MRLNRVAACSVLRPFASGDAKINPSLSPYVWLILVYLLALVFPLYECTHNLYVQTLDERFCHSWVVCQKKEGDNFTLCWPFARRNCEYLTFFGSRGWGRVDIFCSNIWCCLYGFNSYVIFLTDNISFIVTIWPIALQLQYVLELWILKMIKAF
jgi:hypothetical protein